MSGSTSNSPLSSSAPSSKKYRILSLEFRKYSSRFWALFFSCRSALKIFRSSFGASVHSFWPASKMAKISSTLKKFSITAKPFWLNCFFFMPKPTSSEKETKEMKACQTASHYSHLNMNIHIIRFSYLFCYLRIKNFIVQNEYIGCGFYFVNSFRSSLPAI